MKYFVRLNLQGLTKNKQEDSVASTEQKRDSKNDKRQYEIWTFEGLSTLSGGFNLRNKSGNIVKGVPNIVPKGGKPPEEGDRIVVGFHNGNRHNPFCIYSGISSHLGPNEPGGDVALGIWHRYGLRHVGLYHSPETHDLRITGSVPAEDSRTAGHSLRADGYGLWWINGDRVGHLDRENPATEPTDTDLGGPVLSLWWAGGTPWAMSTGGSGSEDEGYVAGLAAGAAAAEPPASFDALNAGEAACTNDTGYDPYGPPYSPREDEDPGTGSATYRAGYRVGFALGYAERWRLRYRYNYEFMGCSPPPDEE